MKHIQKIVAFGFMLIILFVGGIVYIWHNEWQEIETLEYSHNKIDELRKEINEIHIKLIEISLLGETVWEWDYEDLEQYKARRISMDSVLCQFRTIYPLEGIDSVCHLLKKKEQQMYQIVQTLEQQRKINDKIYRQVPVIVQTSVQEQPMKTKRKGFLGIFGKKEEPKPTVTTTMLRTLNKNIVLDQQAQSRRLAEHTDSLALRNAELNIQLQNLIRQIDNSIQSDLQKQESEIASLRERSFMQIGTLMLCLLLLLIMSYLFIVIDIQKRERFKSKLEESIRQNRSLLEMRKKIILTISHDIRGPLNVISGSAELAIDTRDKRKRDSYLNNARYLCRHVVHLLNNLLDVYRLNEAKETPNNVPFRLNVLFDRIAIGAAQIINDKGLLFNHDYRNIDVTVIGDEDRIEQIADNLLSNAVKFTQSGSVGIAASYEDGQLVMDISDTGIGMDEDTLARIFRPFERADNVEHVEGFGLGLSITKGLVIMLGGTIDVISNVGKGTTFHITIPLELTGNIESANIPEVKPVGVLRLPHNVIVIDDDPLQRDIISEMLERNAVSCKVCATASDVVKAMRERDYDILLTDINMPGTNGFALLELLRKSNIGNSQTIPVVAMTARDDDENRPLIQCGFSGCIFKPFSMQELLERISIIMAKSLPLVQDRIDFSPLIANVANPVVILQGLADSTSQDIRGLKEAIAKNDRKAISSVLHRIKPVWEMLGIENRLQPLRNAVKKRNATTADIESLVSDVISAMENMIENINEELETIKDEEQDTDS